MKDQKATHQRRARLIPVGAILLALTLLPAAGGCGSKTLTNLTKQHITQSKGNTPLRQKYDRLTKGMTNAEVVALLGTPSVTKADTKNGFNFTIDTYREGDWRAVIVVSDRHGLVVAHNSDDPSFGKQGGN